MKRLLIIILLLATQITTAQCAMCKAVVEGGDNTMAEGINDGITYLMIFPYILVALLAYFLVRHKRKMKN